jgi:hypothetical protein
MSVEELAGLVCETLANVGITTTLTGGAFVAIWSEGTGLHPEPAGIGPTQWDARCPVRSGHRLMITTGNDEFGCGYCRVKGGVDELRALVKMKVDHVHLT